tara:strand:- start:133 stop:330 length:198 start_codon:yes stop_codon:yes gene_type:complete
MSDYFQDVMTRSAIQIYLQSFGYKAQIDSLNYNVYVQDPAGDSFVVRSIENWDAAYKFIKERSVS